MQNLTSYMVVTYVLRFKSILGIPISILHFKWDIIGQKVGCKEVACSSSIFRVWVQLRSRTVFVIFSLLAWTRSCSDSTSWALSQSSYSCSKDWGVVSEESASVIFQSCPLNISIWLYEQRHLISKWGGGGLLWVALSGLQSVDQVKKVIILVTSHSLYWNNAGGWSNTSQMERISPAAIT